MEVVGGSQGGQTTGLNTSYDISVKKSVEVTKNKSEVGNEKTEIREENIKNAVDKLNKFLEDNGTYAEYEMHDKFKEVMIRIVDSKTKEVVKEIPSKKVLDMVARLCELVGVLVDKKA